MEKTQVMAFFERIGVTVPEAPDAQALAQVQGHMLLDVHCHDEPGRWLVDVGFADNMRCPHVLDEVGWQSDGRDEYQIRPGEEAGRFDLVRRKNGEETSLCSFTREPHDGARIREDIGSREEFGGLARVFGIRL